MPNRKPIPPGELVDRLDLIVDRVSDAADELNRLMTTRYLGGLPSSSAGRARRMLAGAVESLRLSQNLAAEAAIATEAK